MPRIEQRIDTYTRRPYAPDVVRVLSADEAERYEEQLLAGQILVVVHGTADPSAARTALWPT